MRVRNVPKNLIKRNLKLKKSKEELQVDEDSSDQVSSPAEQAIGQTESIFSHEPEIQMPTDPIDEISIINVDNILKSVAHDIEENLEEQVEIVNQTVMEVENPE